MTVRLPKIGVGIMLMKNDSILLGKRIGIHGEGTYGWPGGGLEYGESVMGAVKREAKEETGVSVHDASFLCVSNTISSDRHYIDLEFVVTEFEGNPENLEPEYCEGWNWYNLRALPKPLFQPCHAALDSLVSNRVFHDS